MKILLLFVTVLLLGCSNSGSNLELTKQEQEYVDKTIVVWQPEDNYEPFVSINKDNLPNGISVDYLELISKKTGLKFASSDYRCQLAECLKFVKSGKADIITSIRFTPARSKYLSFTRPYYFIGTSLVSRVKNPVTAGVSKGSAIVEYLILNRQDLTIVEYDSDELAIASLLSMQVDSVMLDKLSAQFMRKRYNYSFDERDIPHDYPLAIATTKNNALLISILNKGISQITENEMEEIDRKWK
jgi:ABC-type amino acid transport substrate-binding protein